MELRCGMAASNGSVETLKVIFLRMVLLLCVMWDWYGGLRVGGWGGGGSICQLCWYAA